MTGSEDTPSSEELVLARELLNRGLGLQILEVTLGIIMILIAFTGNLFVCLATYRNPKLRTIPNYYITTLAVNDTLLSVVVMLLSLVANIAGHWIIGGVLCQFQGFVGTVLGTVSLFTIALTAVNRYFKIVKTKSHPRLYTKKTALRSIAGIWALSSLVPVPYLSIGNRYIYHPGKHMCIFDLDNSNMYYALTTIICFFLVPFGVITFCYFQVFRTVRDHKQKMVSSRRGTEARFSGREVKLTRLLFAIFVGFLFSWIPFVVTDILGVVQGQFSLPRSTYAVYSLSIGLGSCINPIIYGFVNSDFRNEFKAMLELKIFRKTSCPVIAVTIKPQVQCNLESAGGSKADDCQPEATTSRANPTLAV